MKSEEWVLLIDPFKNLIDVYRLLLETERYYVEAAQSVEEAFEKVRTRRYAVVITEFFPEIKDSLRLIQWLKNNSPETYLLMVTYREIDDKAYEELFDFGVGILFLNHIPQKKFWCISKRA